MSKATRVVCVVEKLHHVAVAVPNIEVALQWYLTNFDVAVAFVDKTRALRQFDNIALALILPERHPPHIAVERGNAECHGTLVSHRDAAASVYITDPWGNAIEIMKAKHRI